MTTPTLIPAPLLILGGAHSGKSEWATRCLLPDRNATIIGTAPLVGQAIKKRLDQLKSMRPPAWETLETASDLTATMAAAAERSPQILVDSVSHWILAQIVAAEAAGVMEALEEVLTAQVDELVATIQKWRDRVRFVLTSNEMGGGVPPSRGAERLARQLIGLTNQKLAVQSASVYLIQAGIPTVLKSPVLR